MIKDYFILARRNLRKRRLRSWLTMIGIIISIATIFMLVSLSLGLQGAVEEQFRILGTDKIFVQPATGFLGPPGSVGGTLLTEKDVDVIEKVRGVKDLSYFTAGSARVEVGGEERYMLVWGIPPENLDVYKEVESFNIAEGRYLEEGDKNRVLLGYFFPEAKDFKKEVNAGNKITINDQDFKVVGTVERIGNPEDDRMILMDMDSFRMLFDIPDRVDWIMVQVEPGEDVNEVADRIEKKLRSFRGVTEDNQDFDIMKPEDLLESFGNVLNIITAFLAGVAAISLLVGAIGIANTMYTSVLERTNEIGTMKAIGAKNKDVLMIFLIESGLLGLIGATIGVVLGYTVSKTIEFIAVTQLNTDLLQAAAPVYLVVGCLAFGFLIGTVSGTLPAYQASKTNVVDALRYE
jgi:putative ABC transport system permease protein